MSSEADAHRTSDEAGPDEIEGFELERFEYIRATDALALVRIVGRWRNARPVDLSRVRLVTGDGGESRDFSPLASGSDAIELAVAGRDAYAVAFSVPLALVEEAEVSFGLRASSGRGRALGAPTHRPLRGRFAPVNRPSAANESLSGGRLRTLMTESVELQRNLADLRRAVRGRAGMAEQPVEPRPADQRTGGDAQPIPRIREQVRHGLERVASLEGRLAMISRELRAGSTDDRAAG